MFDFSKRLITQRPLGTLGQLLDKQLLFSRVIDEPRGFFPHTVNIHSAFPDRTSGVVTRMRCPSPPLVVAISPDVHASRFVVAVPWDALAQCQRTLTQFGIERRAKCGFCGAELISSAFPLPLQTSQICTRGRKTLIRRVFSPHLVRLSKRSVTSSICRWHAYRCPAAINTTRLPH